MEYHKALIVCCIGVELACRSSHAAAALLEDETRWYCYYALLCHARTCSKLDTRAQLEHNGATEPYQERLRLEPQAQHVMPEVGKRMEEVPMMAYWDHSILEL